MRLKISVVSVTVLTFLVAFLVQDAVKAQTTMFNLCERTDEVRVAIIGRLTGVNDTCDEDPVVAVNVTLAQLASIRGTLDLRDPTPLDTRGQTDDDITSLLVGDFAGLTRLEELDLSENSLTTLPPGIFSDLTALTRLDLFDNSLTTLSPGVFSDLTALTRLDLGFNDLPTAMLSGSGFNALTNLTILDLSANQLTDLPSDIFADLTALRILTLDQNQLTTLPAGLFSGLTALRILTLNQNQLTELPDEIFSGLTNLTGVNVSGNTTDPLSLTVIPKVISEGMAVLEVAQGVPFTRVTGTVEIIGGTIGDSTATRIQVRISRGETQSAPFRFVANVPSPDFRVHDLTSAPENILYGFDNMRGSGYSGLQLAEVAFGVEERIERVNQRVLPAIGREVIRGVQNVVSERIGRLVTSPVIALPTAQVAGQSTLSDLLTFTAQTFDKVHNQGQSFAIETLFEETSFALPLNGDYTSRTGFDSFALWGGADYQNISGGEDVSWDGTMTNFHIGSDMRVTETVLGGVAVSWSQGAFDYEDTTSGRNQEGEYELDLWSIHPYGGWTPLPWFNLWVVGGYGLGEVTVKDEAVAGSESSDVQAYSGSVGMSVQGVLARVMRLRVKGQTSITTMDVEDNGEISSLTTEAYQHKVSVEASYTARSVVPTLEIGWRSDGGDGETGMVLR